MNRTTINVVDKPNYDVNEINDTFDLGPFGIQSRKTVYITGSVVGFLFLLFLFLIWRRNSQPKTDMDEEYMATSNNKSGWFGEKNGISTREALKTKPQAVSSQPNMGSPREHPRESRQKPRNPRSQRTVRKGTD
jgi:hypothetical protein